MNNEPEKQILPVAQTPAKKLNWSKQQEILGETFCYPITYVDYKDGFLIRVAYLNKQSEWLIELFDGMIRVYRDGYITEIERIKQLAEGLLRSGVNHLIRDFDLHLAPVPEPPKNLLDWEKEEDDDGNAHYWAPSIYHDEGATFYFRIDPVMVSNRVKFSVARSEKELIGDEIGVCLVNL